MKGSLRHCQNYRIISLISHYIKVLLRIMLNHLKSKVEELLSEKQAGFRAVWSTMEQVFSCRIFVEKHLQHQKDMFHKFVDLKKAFDHVWHDGLWQILREFNLDNGIISHSGHIQRCHQRSSSGKTNGRILSDNCRCETGIQGYVLSPTLFNLFLERNMQEILNNHNPSISVGDRPVWNLCFADETDLIAQDLTNRLFERSGAYGMEISS